MANQMIGILEFNSPILPIVSFPFILQDKLKTATIILIN